VISLLYDSPRNPEIISPIPHSCDISHPSHSPWFHHPNNIWRWVHITKLLIIQFSPVPSLPPIVTQIRSSAIWSRTSPASLLRLLWETKFRTRIKQAQLQFRILQLHIFRQQTGKQVIRDQKIRGIPCIYFLLHFFIYANLICVCPSPIFGTCHICTRSVS